MLQAEILEHSTKTIASDSRHALNTAISNSWQKVAPFWPLKNLIAVNPIAGFEHLPFEDGLKQAKAYYQQQEMPGGMQHVNRESIKWLQAFFDEGQATIPMPLRENGLLYSTLTLLQYDTKVTGNSKQKKQWLNGLRNHPLSVIAETLSLLHIPAADQELFLTLLLTTLPGWAAHIQYRTKWADAQDAQHRHTVTQAEYLAFRVVITYLVWPEAKDLLRWHKRALDISDVTESYKKITIEEAIYRRALLSKLDATKPAHEKERAEVQLVFCIDVRSEPFRRALERQGNYETFGFAGFFGVPVSIGDAVTGDSYASCPVLLKPAYHVPEKPNCSHQACTDGYTRLRGIKKLYQSLKYTFTTPFSLVETLGMASGIWMGLRSLLPDSAASLQGAVQQSIAPGYSVTPDISNIPHTQQVAFAAGALKTMGLTEHFARLVVLCGHGSTTENNAYATALDCGACGGRHGAPNARIMATILNDQRVRIDLRSAGIDIPDDTEFLAAEHNTTTDEVVIYAEPHGSSVAEQIASLKQSLELARKENSLWRSSQMGVAANSQTATKQTARRAKDWAQVRPEWGLARNATFIVGPRWLTRDVDLEGRSFLHSYEWEKDTDSAALTTILTAPMVVGQWINAQYFFSTYDNVAFGGGSKITKNITGKIGIMQGNASDLMHGLPLQSVYKTDTEAYHQPMRLLVVVHAPKNKIDAIIQQQPILQKLFGNGWVHLVCNDPQDRCQYQLNRDLTWEVEG